MVDRDIALARIGFSFILGFILGSIGYNPTTWQFWIFLVIGLVGFNIVFKNSRGLDEDR